MFGFALHQTDMFQSDIRHKIILNWKFGLFVTAHSRSYLDKSVLLLRFYQEKSVISPTFINELLFFRNKQSIFAKKKTRPYV